MNKKSIGFTFMIVAFLVGAFTVSVMSGCKSDKKQESSQSAASQPEAKHKSHHGGCLNAIEMCAVGHAEVKVEGNILKLWFVGGENETDKAVRVSDKQIVFVIKADGGPEKTLTLDAKPNELAEEKIGDCSCFEGKADWLTGIKKFTAGGKVNLKGKNRPIEIE